ncbi:zinc finger BED domain-containing protein isoform X2 [Melanotaenia boesemani]|nr:zinc finger BED domain-containing protein isoform X2 [Melanotaenia boesemani]
MTTVNDDSAVGGLLEMSQKDAAEQIKHEEACGDRPVKHSRRRSLIWRIFEQLDSSGAARCRICAKKLHVSGGISNLRRHLSTRHPEVLSDLLASGEQPPVDSLQDLHDDGLTNEACLGTEQRHGPEEAVLEEGNSNIMTTLIKTDPPVISGLPYTLEGDSAEQPTNAKTSDDCPERHTRRKSLIWKYFDRLESLDAACCRVCMRRLQCPEGGGTSNLHRHLSKKHPKIFSELVSNRQNSSHLNVKQNSNAEGGIWNTFLETPEEAPLEESDSNSMTTLDETDDPVSKDLMDTLQGHSPQQTTYSCDSNGRRTLRRSLIWKHFERLESLNAARCRLCMKKLQCFESRSTGNLHRHLSKRHPKLISQFISDPASELKDSRASQVEKRVFNRERELIEALRRAQREEAQTLEHQRELLEKLRAVSAREAAAEKEEIELLRKAQQEEAKDLSKQQEELEKGKAELQKKWDELQQEKEKLLLLSGSQEGS